MDANTVFLMSMPFSFPVGRDAWCRADKAQPIRISLRVNNVKSIQDAATSDDVSKSLDYGKLYKTIQRNLNSQDHYSDVREVAERVIASVQSETPGTSGSVQVELPKAALRAENGIIYSLKQDSDPASSIQYEILQIRGVRCACIIGVNPHERIDKQVVIVQLTFRGHSGMKTGSGPPNSGASATAIAVDKYYNIIEAVVKVSRLAKTITASPICDFTQFSFSPSLPPPKPNESTLAELLTHYQRAEGSSYQTIEALVTVLCRDVTMGWDIPEVEISAEKPYAIPSIGAAGVCVRRRRSFFAESDIWKA